MKALKASDLRALKAEELVQKLDEARENLRKLTMRKATRQLEDTVSLRIARRDIARVTTLINEKAKAAGKEEGANKEAAAAAGKE